jgi:hypothetical protein
VPWETQLDQILDDDTTLDSQKTQRLLDLIPTLPLAALPEAAQHLTHLADDETYQPVASLVVQTNLPDDVYAVLLADVSERPNSVRFPLLLQIARAPNHPESGEAREDLAFYLEEDFGADWARWETELKAWLEQNP